MDDLRGWLRDGLFVSESRLHGRGVFTRVEIAEGERVIRWGGRLLPSALRDAGQVRPHTAVDVADGIVLAALPADEATPDDFLNHSCDPNLWMADAITLIARRAISSGEELTADYVFWVPDAYAMKTPCACGAARCRGSIRGTDRQDRELRERYRGHFSPHVERRLG